MMASSSRPPQPNAQDISCPLCDYTADDTYVIQLHIDAVHDKPEPPSRPPASSQPEFPRRMYKVPLTEPEQDPYDPFKYQLPNNDSREVVGASQHGSANARAPKQEEESEYVTCEWKDCGEPVSLMQLEEHLAMHEEADIMDDNDGEEDDYRDELGQKDFVLDKRERRGEALMEAADKKRYIPKKEGPSNRQPKKLGQMERRLESEALAEQGDVRIVDDDLEEDDDYSMGNVSEGEKTAKAGHSDGDESEDYEIISREGIPDDLDDQGKDSKHRKHKKEEKAAKKLEKKGAKQVYGGYASSEPRQPSKRNALAQGTAKLHKPKFKKSELGPYANERKMPEWLREALEAGGKEVLTKHIGSDGTLVLRRSFANETAGLIPIIRQLLEVDPSVSKAYVCHPSVKHVFKEHSGANGFCGYRNIQMMASYCRKVQVQGCERLYGNRIPTVLQIQDWIEQAWDMGINAHARVETGGIKNTRKYIGSSEVEAMFSSFGATTLPHQFSEPNQQINALRHVWQYFSNEFDQTDKVVQTDKPPIYFQHYGHSLTIVGIERYKDGSMSLICFDPMFTPSQAIRGLVGQKRLRPNIAYAKLLKPFRKGGSYLKRYSMFEMVELIPQPDLSLSIYE